MTDWRLLRGRRIVEPDQRAAIHGAPTRIGKSRRIALTSNGGWADRSSMLQQVTGASHRVRRLPPGTAGPMSVSGNRRTNPGLPCGRTRVSPAIDPSSDLSSASNGRGTNELPPSVAPPNAARPKAPMPGLLLTKGLQPFQATAARRTAIPRASGAEGASPLRPC